MAATLVSCVQVAGPSQTVTSEEELAARAQALQRTILEATATGAVAGAGGAYVFGGRGPSGVAVGAIGGIPIGFAAGTYVGFLQQRYASDEARLARLRADIDATNAETAATVRTMQAVLDRQRSELTAARASADPARLSSETQEARVNQQNMTRAIAGAEGRLAEFTSTRRLNLVQGQATGVDAQVSELSGRITAMRAISATLAEEL